MKLIPGTRIIQTGPHMLEVKVGAKPAIQFQNLTSAQMTWLLNLLGPPTLTPARTPLPPHHATLVAGLRAAGAIMTHGRKVRHSTQVDGVLSAEALSLTHQELNGPRIVAARGDAIIAIKGISRTTFQALTTLVAAGVKRFVIDDQRPMDPMEFTHEGLDVGAQGSRQEAVHSFLTKSFGHCEMLSGNTEVDAVILHAEEVSHPLVTAGLHAQGVSHLVTTSRPEHIEIGPFVIPGETGCCNCLLLSRTSPAQRADFTRFANHITAAAVRALHVPDGQGAAAARVAGGMVAGQILAYLDGLVPQAARELFTVGTLGPVPHTTPWRAHPDCMCLIGAPEITGAATHQTTVKRS